jgi:hypothetical protein
MCPEAEDTNQNLPQFPASSWSRNRKLERSYLQEETIREHLEKARRRVAEMGDPRNEESSPKVKQAQVRGKRRPETVLTNSGIGYAA